MSKNKSGEGGQLLAQLPCAGLEGCHELEGVMYDFFVHDPACQKSPEQRAVRSVEQVAVMDVSVTPARVRGPQEVKDDCIAAVKDTTLLAQQNQDQDLRHAERCAIYMPMIRSCDCGAVESEMRAGKELAGVPAELRACYPCPFCRGTNATYDGVMCVSCPACGATGPDFHSDAAAAVAAWNERGASQ